MSMQNFIFFDVGEGLIEVEIVVWKVVLGDMVVINDVFCEIEMVKFFVELLLLYVGVVGELFVEEGMMVEVGIFIIIFVIDVCDDVGFGVVVMVEVLVFEEGGGLVFVGYGNGGGVILWCKCLVECLVCFFVGVIVKLLICKFVWDFGVDLMIVMFMGVDGEVIRDDVVKYVLQVSVFCNIEMLEWGIVCEEIVFVLQIVLIGFVCGIVVFCFFVVDDDCIELIFVKGVCKVMFFVMVQSVYFVLYVIVWKEIDVICMMEFVKCFKVLFDYVDIKVLLLFIMVRVVIWVVCCILMVNVVWIDIEVGVEIVVCYYVNFGIVVVMLCGFFVLNIKDVQDFSMKDFVCVLNWLMLIVWEGKILLVDQQGGMIIIMNIGVFGMDVGILIINFGEVGIVVMGIISQKLWVVDGEVCLCWVIMVVGFFDYCVIDGDGMSCFIVDVVFIFEEFVLLVD